MKYELKPGIRADSQAARPQGENMLIFQSDWNSGLLAVIET